MSLISWLKCLFGETQNRTTADALEERDPPQPPARIQQNEPGIQEIIVDGALDKPFENTTKDIFDYAQRYNMTNEDVAFAVENAIYPLVQKMLDDGILSNEEEAIIDKILFAYGINANDLPPATQTLLAKGQIVRNLIEGNIQPCFSKKDLPFRFMKTELLIWAWADVPMSAVKTVSRIEGRTRGVSVRIMKGVYWRTGGFSGERVSRQEVQNMGNAFVAVTSKHIYYMVGHETKRIKHEKILSITPYSDAVSITPEGARALPLIFYADDPWFFANVVQNAPNWG